MKNKDINLIRGRQQGKSFPPEFFIGATVPLKLTSKLCLYFWEWYCAKEHVRKFNTLAKYEHGYMTHNPMFLQNTRNCILYRNALRKIPALRKLHKLFIKEVKVLGNINAVVTKYTDVTSEFDSLLQSRIDEVNVSRGKQFSENTVGTLKWQRVKDRSESKEPTAFTISFG